MRLLVTAVQGTGFTEVTVEHNCQKLVWKTGIAYSKVKLNDPQRVFQEFNDYLDYMGPEVQNRVWDVLVEIRDVMSMSMDGLRMSVMLRMLLRRLYEPMPMKSFRNWLTTVGNIHIPSDTARVITAQSRYNKVDQTYLIHDYVNLASVALAMRILIPILGEYIDQASDAELCKENEAVGLLDECEMVSWPEGEVGPDGTEVETVFEKLAMYIRFCVDGEPTTLKRLWDGMSSIELPVHLQSRVLVRRLTIIPLNDSSHHGLVANIWRYVTSNMNPVERSTAERVNEKRPEGGGDDEDKTSFIEAHKTKIRVSPGDIESFELDALNAVLLVTKVDPTIDLLLLDECLAEVNAMSQVGDYPHQTLLAQWVMAKAFPAQAYSHINQLAKSTLFACSQALLWHWGFKDIALFMQVSLFQSGDHMSLNQMNAPRMNTRILAKYKDDMATLFPHERRQRIPQNGQEPEPMNIAGISITNLNASIRASHWVFGGPVRLFQEANQITSNKVLIPPANIKATITELVIHLGRINSTIDNQEAFGHAQL